MIVMSNITFLWIVFCQQPGTLPPIAADVAKTYRNPVMDAAMADPHVIRVDGLYYLYGTYGSRGCDVFTSEDLVRWTHRGVCFDRPEGVTWAPDVFHDREGNGRFYLYYSAYGPADDPPPREHIGVAVADRPDGPFSDRGLMIADAIDAHLFRDRDGTLYLYYTRLTPRANEIWVQPMSDPLTKRGKPQRVLAPEAPWEQHGFPVTEAPWMIRRNDTYYLMYSGSSADTPEYAIGYATAPSPMGPFRRFSGNPIARGNDRVIGPGHHCVVEGPRGNLWMVYHQKRDRTRDFHRFLAIDPLWFDTDGTIHARVSRDEEHPAP